MSRLFISYRRDDAAGEAGRLADHLYRRFGEDRVFLDIDSIEPGRDFVRTLETSLEQTAAVLVVIGRHWTTLRTADGTRRLDAQDDFVRLEVEAALARAIPVVPVLVQGASMPAAADLPVSLAALATRQAFVLDHAEFHADAERLCDRLAGVLGGRRGPMDAVVRMVRRWWPAAVIVLLLGLGMAAYGIRGDGSGNSTSPGAADTLDQETQALLAEADAQRRRQQYAEALATIARARTRAPSSTVVRDRQEELAMESLRNVRLGEAASFGDAIAPGTRVIDAALATATGERRADLLAHTGWSTFLLWRDGNRSLNPEEWYREALGIDATNPYANAMLAHWILFRSDDVAQATALFATAHRTGRARDAVRNLEWAAYRNTNTNEADVARIRLAAAMRREGTPLIEWQTSALWSPYYFAISEYRAANRDRLLDALPPDEHLELLTWAFDEHVRHDEGRSLTLRYYRALLHAKAGRTTQAVDELTALEQELARDAGTILLEPVAAARTRLLAGK